MIKRVLIGFVAIVALAALALLLTGNKHVLIGITQTYFRAKNKPDIDDFHYFAHRKLSHGECKTWPVSQRKQRAILSPSALDKAVAWETTALLVVHQDSILFERYWEDYSPEKISNSFSMAKSFTSLAVGVAIDQGKIGSVNDKVTTYLPWLNSELDAKLTIKHLLQMRSNIDFGESYSNPFGYQAKSYYGDNLKDLTDGFHVSSEPGSEWEYQGGNTVLLNLVLEEATGQKLGDYLAEHIYSQLGTCNDAFWALDQDEELEKAFSAFYATAPDFARIGELALNYGSWGEQQLVSESYMKESFDPAGAPDAEGNVVLHYGYQWWLGRIEGYAVHYAQGMRGQYIATLPELDLIVVKLGHQRSEEKVDNIKLDLRVWLEEAIKMSRLPYEK